MITTSRSRYLALGLFFGLVAGIASAQAPDCTGISKVFNNDPDMIGELTTVRVASGLTNPVFMTQAPGDDERFYIVEQRGVIKILRNGVVAPTPFLDIDPLVRCCGEEGLLSMAFPADHQTTGHFFLYYTNNSGNQQIVRYTRVNADKADSASEVTVITVAHPTFGNHNGGQIDFSPIDGHLYIGTGDGGSGCDPGPGAGNALNTSNNLGKMLRLDVSSLPYSTTGNPFDGGTPGNDEIWSYGLRNPWRFSFDRLTGSMYIGDVGQNVWEEVSCMTAGVGAGGENFGWVAYEGAHCPNPSCGAAASCTQPDYSPPIREYNQAGTPCSITGGYVYRGCRMDALQGTYFYSDACDDFVRTFRTNGNCSAPGPVGLLDTNREFDLEPPAGGGSIEAIYSFAEDNHGEMYIVNGGGAGEIFKILPDLDIMETSGAGAQQLLPDASGGFTWEDLNASSDHPITGYRVYRATDAQGTFDCARIGATPDWNDPATPTDNETFYYLVTARNAGGEETLPGVQSNSSPRTVNTASACP